MANNRMYLCHPETQQAVYLGKRLGDGWYGCPENVAEKISEMFAKVEEQCGGTDDGFCIGLEDERGNERAILVKNPIGAGNFMRKLGTV